MFLGRCWVPALFVVLAIGGCAEAVGGSGNHLAAAAGQGKEGPCCCFKRKEKKKEENGIFQYMHNFAWTNSQKADVEMKSSGLD